jgi:hypothetical protein
MSPDVGRLALCQVESALASLSDGEMIALMKIARLYARKTPYDKEDFIQETVARVLSGGEHGLRVPAQSCSWGSHPQHCLGMGIWWLL